MKAIVNIYLIIVNSNQTNQSNSEKKIVKVEALLLTHAVLSTCLGIVYYYELQFELYFNISGDTEVKFTEVLEENKASIWDNENMYFRLWLMTN